MARRAGLKRAKKASAKGGAAVRKQLLRRALAYPGAQPVYGPDYIIPAPFDPRLISRVSSAVACLPAGLPK